ncbi:MerR family transcriptional regulator [Aeromicrobium halocynthiae]|uniref:MerR family transcriptional regulator n=1 Tax=Aeromicrobium halocynthiae TaxID=560557 RepID=A0ABN2W7Y2_9ACTN
MRSQEVAELAGVSVRTLRHYHQIGLLPEPERRSNGYRRYDLATIATLLRIRRLTELGVPLNEVGAMLEEAPAADVLEEVDRSLIDAIERLQEQRHQIARLRESGRRADVPEGLAELISLGPSGPSAGVLGQMDQDALLLIARVVGVDHLTRQGLDDLADALRPLLADPDLAAVSARFDRLADDASREEAFDVADAMAAVLTPMVARLEQTETARAIGRAGDRWPDVSQDGRLNPAQARAMRRLLESLREDGPGPAPR